MVRDVTALRGAAARRTSGAGVRGDENARAVPGSTSRPPLRTIQPPVSGATRLSLPGRKKCLGARTGKAPAGAPRASTSLARSFDARSRNSEDVLKLQLEVEVFKTILGAAHAELKDLRYTVEYLESDIASILREKGKDEIRRQAEAETAEVIISLQQEVDHYSSIVEDLSTHNSLLQSELLSLRNEFSKLLDEKKCCEAQCFILKEKLEMALSLIDQSQQMAAKTQAYAEDKEKENKLLERSIEDLEITICELENMLNIVKKEAKHERMQRDELVILVDSIRQSQDIQNELLCAQDVFPEIKTEIGPVQEGCASCMTKPPMVGVEPASQAENPDEPTEDSSLDEVLLETKETCLEMGGHLEQYNVSEQPEFHGVESWSEEQLPPPSVELVAEIVEENELPPPAPVRLNDPVDYRRAPSDELKRLRSRNHYKGQRTATDRRFWSIEQQDLYTSIYSSAELANMQWISWEHIDSIEQFAGVRNRCAHLGLEKIMSYCCHWDNDIIRQFYSTVYISADKSSMTWMADGRKITTHKKAWQELFSIPSGARTEIHSQLFLTDDEMRTLYSAPDYTLGNINGLSPLASIANKILRTTIYPRFGHHARVGRATHSWNVLCHVVEQHKFDIISFIFGEIDSLISDITRKLLYAPYIMGMIMRNIEYEGPRQSRHNPYKPKRQYNLKLSKRSHPSAAPAVLSHEEAAPAVVPMQPAFQPEVAAAGGEAYVEPVDDHHQFARVEAVQGQLVQAQPVTHTDLFQVVENGLRPKSDTLAQHISSSSSSQVQASSSYLAPSLHAAATSPAPPQAPRTTSLPSSEQPSVLYTDNPYCVSDQLVDVRSSPFSGFRWYQKM